MIKFFKNIAFAAVTVAFASLAQPAWAISLDFGNLFGARVQIQGSTLSFLNNSSGYAFQVGNVTGGSEDSLGDLGKIDGNFSIGAITSSGGTESANVSGLGIVSINDGLLNLTGTIDWKMIKTEGTSSALNLQGMLNLTAITYSGAQQDLIDLAAAGVGSDTVNFTFSGGQTLTQLTSGPAYKTTFSGSISGSPLAFSVPDGGSTLALLGGAFLSFVLFRRKLSSFLS